MQKHDMEERVNKNMNSLLLTMKFILLGISAWMITNFMGIIDFSIVDLSSIKLLLDSGVRLLTFIGFYVFKFAWLVCDLLSGLAFTPLATTGYFNRNLQASISLEYSTNVIERWFDVPINYDYMADVTAFTSNVYVLIFQIVVIAMIYYAIRSVISNSPKFAIKTVTFLNVMIIIPLTLIGIQEMVDIFFAGFDLSTILGISGSGVTNPHVLPYPLNPSLLYQAISSSFMEFVTSRIFTLSLSAFLYLEIAFQLSYMYQVISPSEERKERLRNQLIIIREAASSAVIDIKKIQEQSEKEKKTLLMDEEGNIIQEKKISVREMLRTGGSTGFSDISTMIEKRKLEEKAKKMIEARHETRRLSNYINKLIQMDPEAENTLTARDSAPQAGKLIYSTVIDIVTRIVGITFLVFIVAQTPLIMKNVFLVPPAMSESVEMFTPEVILTLLIPIILLFPMVSVVIRKTKESHLKQKLAEERKRREGIEELEKAEVTAA